MKVFLSAAAPWLVLGAAIAIFLAFYVRRKPSHTGAAGPEQSEERQDPGNYMTEGMCLGMCLGVVLGMTVLDNLAVGLSLGMCLGLAIGANMKKEKKQ